MLRRGDDAPLDQDGVLLDIDGVLVVSWAPIPGAAEALAALADAGVPVRLLTNTTSRTRAEVAERLDAAGIAVDPASILTAPAATADHLRTEHPGARVYLLSSGDVLGDLAGIDLVEEDADVVVVGGAGPEFTYERMNTAFRFLQAGAALVAMHRNLCWRTAAGLALDGGAYLAGLELASGTEAVVLGKPSSSLYRQAVASLALTDPARVVMVGDDIDADVVGAQAAGLRGVLVRTGKFRPQDLDAPDHRPDAVIDSISDLPALLGL
jgi:HAD superfamily hydrolase (TIGR01458 family)